VVPLNRVIDRPIILGIVGDSATGKSTIADGIAEILGPDRVTVICSDDYHRYSRVERAENKLSALDPRANYIDILEQHIRALRKGHAILKPIYNHDGGTLDAPEYIEPKEYVIIEGLLGYSSRSIRTLYDVRVYLEPLEALRIEWKIKRDTGKRGHTVEGVMQALEKRKYDTVNFIQPQRTYADIIVQFYPPEGYSTETGGTLNVRHTLRPTLPHPDLTPILDADKPNGLQRRLARDVDGKPVDVLEVAGSVDADQAKAAEDLLWDLMPEARHLRANVGKRPQEKDSLTISHPIALSQLVIAYHLVKAAMGVYAI